MLCFLESFGEGFVRFMAEFGLAFTLLGINLGQRLLVVAVRAVVSVMPLQLASVCLPAEILAVDEGNDLIGLI